MCFGTNHIYLQVLNGTLQATTAKLEPESHDVNSTRSVETIMQSMGHALLDQIAT